MAPVATEAPFRWGCRKSPVERGMPLDFIGNGDRFQGLWLRES